MKYDLKEAREDYSKRIAFKDNLRLNRNCSKCKFCSVLEVSYYTLHYCEVKQKGVTSKRCLRAIFCKYYTR